MSKQQIENLFASFGDVPAECKIQVDIQKKSLLRLLDRLDAYDWTTIAESGVKLKERDLEPKVQELPAFLVSITSPMTVTLFNPDGKVSTNVIPPLLETLLHSKGMYLGPVGRKMTIKAGDKEQEVVNALRYHFDKDTNTLYLTC